MSEYFSKPKSFCGNVKNELDVSNYAVKADYKKAIGVPMSEFTKKTSKSDFDELDTEDIDKLKTVTVDLNKLNNVVNNDVIKKTE